MGDERFVQESEPTARRLAHDAPVYDICRRRFCDPYVVVDLRFTVVHVCSTRVESNSFHAFMTVSFEAKASVS